MWLSEAQKILQKKYKEKYCTVSIETDGREEGLFNWCLYVGDTGNGYSANAPTFKEAFEKMHQHFHPKKIKSQDVQIKGGN